MTVDDFGVVECYHWQSAQQAQQYMERQGIAPMLAFDGERYLGQLYLQEYDPQFRRERYSGATDEEPGVLRVMLLTASADSGQM